MKSITVEEKTWETLTLLKVKGKFSSMDKLLNSLVNHEKCVRVRPSKEEH